MRRRNFDRNEFGFGHRQINDDDDDDDSIMRHYYDNPYSEETDNGDRYKLFVDKKNKKIFFIYYNAFLPYDWDKSIESRIKKGNIKLYGMATSKEDIYRYLENQFDKSNEYRFEEFDNFRNFQIDYDPINVQIKQNPDDDDDDSIMHHYYDNPRIPGRPQRRFTGDRGFFPPSVARTLPPLYTHENTPRNQIKVPVKFFMPYGTWRWYAIEYDPNRRLFFGLVHGHELELGYFSLNELKEASESSMMTKIERDTSWDPNTTLEEVYRKIKERGEY